MSRREFSTAVVGLALIAAMGAFGVIFQTRSAEAGGWPRGGMAGSGGGSFAGGDVAAATGFPNGTAAAPSVYWTSDSDGSGTGWFRQGANNIAGSINGTETLRLTSSELRLLNGAALWTGTIRDVSGNQQIFFSTISGTTLSNQAAGTVNPIFSIENTNAVTSGVLLRLRSGGVTHAEMTGTEFRTVDGVYLTAGDVNAGAPPAGDCDADAERGRLSIDSTNNLLYVCNGATRAWDTIALTN